MRKQFATAALAAMFLLSAGAPEARRQDPIEHFVAQSASMTSPARLTLRPIDIVLYRWSTYINHRELATALTRKGPMAFLDLLCGFGQVGIISVLGAPDIPIRYAWSVDEGDGGRRIYLATDERVVLEPRFFGRTDPEPLTFVELRIDRDGVGEGKLSDTLRLSMDESRDVIELRDYARRPVHLISVRRVSHIDE
jgi:hypothetical protein